MYVGNLVPAKNLERLLAAFAVARIAWGDGALALVGDGPEASARRLPIGESVHMQREVPVEVPRWFEPATSPASSRSAEFGRGHQARAVGRSSWQVPAGA